MPLKIIRNDITKVSCDAIVNAANVTLLGGGGVDGAIHRAAGRGLYEECKTLGGCEVGHAKITGAYMLPAKFVIHTVGPRWRFGKSGEKEKLESCYRESLKLAHENNCESVAFPLISSGIFGYPKDKALRVAIDTISEFLLDHDMLVYIVVFDKSSFQISEKLYVDIATYIDDNYVKEYSEITSELSRSIEYEYRSRGEKSANLKIPDEDISEDECMGIFVGASEPVEQDTGASRMPPSAPAPDKSDSCLSKKGTSELKLPNFFNKSCENSLVDAVNQIDESFSEMLLRKIDEAGMTDSQCYKKANIDRKLFSKIRSDLHYRPSKATAIAFAIALELSLDETKDMLMKAGFALSHSNKFDIIIEYFIKSGNYNIFEINEALFAFDQATLGA